MPRLVLPVNDITRAGLAVPAETNGSTVDQHVIANDGQTVLLVRNINAGAQTVSLKLQTLIDGQSLADRVISIPAAASRYIGPFPVGIYTNALFVDVSSVDLRLTALHLSS